jgi:hypothetical protein
MPLATDEHRVIKITPLHVKGDPLNFPTIITQFTDSWRPKWQTQNVYGRMDPIGFYAGTERHLQLGFRVISDDETEAVQNMQNLQRLIQYQYPAYQSAGGLSTLKAPPYFDIKLMNVMAGKTTKGLQGYINGPIQIDPGFQAKERAQYFDEKFTKLYFSDVHVVIALTVLHEHRVGFYGKKGFGSGYANYPYNVGKRSTATDSTKPTPPAPTADKKKKPNPPKAAPPVVPPEEGERNTDVDTALDKTDAELARMEKILTESDKYPSSSP